jgi:hypothetical protein
VSKDRLCLYQEIMRLLCIVLLFVLSSFHGQSQIPVAFSTDHFISPADSQKLSFRFSDQSFFKNNEYFNTLNEGATLIGFQAEPTVVYHPGPTTRLEAGGRFLKYFGRDGIYRIEPVFRFQYQPVSYFQTILGTLYGGSNHGLIEPLYRWEKDFTDPTENGVQFLFKTKRLKADVWLDWEKFILPKDSFQEELTVGTTFGWYLLPADRKFNIEIPIQALVSHHGGQITSINKPLQTILNYASGFNALLHPETGKIKEINFEFWYMGYTDMSPQKLQAFRRGYAIYPRTGIDICNFTAQAGYFHGDMFISPKGETLFHSALIPYDGEKRPIRDLATFKLSYRKQIQKGISLAAYVETYTDFEVPQTDYCYGLHLLINRTFFIAKVR